MTNLTIMPENYDTIRTGIVELLKAARSAAARNVNSIMTGTYWEIGRRIVTLEQGGEHRFVRKGEKGIHEAPLLQLFLRSLRDVPAGNKTIAGRTHNAQLMFSVLAPLHGPAIAVTSNQRPQIAVLIQLVSSLPFT
jgi:hypothetical protein